MKPKEITVTAVLLTLLMVCSQIILPIGPVPITLQTLAVLMVGYFLPPASAVLVTSLYLVVGVLGLPIFSAFSGGFQTVLMPSFGFIIGFIPASFVQALYLQKHSSLKTKHLIISGALNFLITYLFGLTYMAALLHFYLNSSLTLTGILMAGLVPFVPGDLLKLATGVILAKRTLPLLHRGFSASL